MTQASFTRKQNSLPQNMFFHESHKTVLMLMHDYCAYLKQT